MELRGTNPNDVIVVASKLNKMELFLNRNNCIQK